MKSRAEFICENALAYPLSITHYPYPLLPKPAEFISLPAYPALFSAFTYHVSLLRLLSPTSSLSFTLHAFRCSLRLSPSMPQRPFISPPISSFISCPVIFGSPTFIRSGSAGHSFSLLPNYSALPRTMIKMQRHNQTNLLSPLLLYAPFAR